MKSIGLVANVYNEINALPGWLETHTPFFDDIRILHAGPGGVYSTDGTIELLEKWNIPIEYASIDEGFGVVRTRAIRSSPCDYVMILDADERFYSNHTAMVCLGQATAHSDADRILRSYDFRNLKENRPDWGLIKQLGAQLFVERGIVYDQGETLRKIIADDSPDAILTIRRHWHDFTFKRPTQNWMIEPDWQMRIVRNDDSIRFDPGTKMHERLTGANTFTRADTRIGPFFDHFHFTFKRMEEEQRAHDVAIYDAIHKNETPPMEI